MGKIDNVSLSLDFVIYLGFLEHWIVARLFLCINGCLQLIMQYDCLFGGMWFDRAGLQTSLWRTNKTHRQYIIIDILLALSLLYVRCVG